MDLNLEGHVAAIVGGAAGLGLAIAQGFLAERASVAIIDRAATTTEIAEKVGARGVIADVTDAVSVERAASAVRDRFGRCDHVVYAAAIGSGKRGFPFWNLQPADWPQVLEVNLIGAVNVAQAFRPALVASQGTLLLIASVAGQIGSQTDPPYSASKAGLINFAQCAARDFAPHGVRVNSLCPGMVKTALNRSTYEAWAATQPSPVSTYDEWAAEKIRQLVPLGRWQEPEDIAAMTVFLASPRAKNVTGQTINVDGGYVMHW
jgi:NAD(P)-dependent dehydrogenase (short-subunit alcohol dehydrogenase family)